MAGKRFVGVYWLILSFFIIAGPIFAFPITKTIPFERVPHLACDLHVELSHSVLPTEIHSKENYFACCFNFWVKKVDSNTPIPKIIRLCVDHISACDQWTFSPERGTFITTPGIPRPYLSAVFKNTIKPLVDATRGIDERFGEDLRAPDDKLILTQLSQGHANIHAIHILNQQPVIDKIFKALELAVDDEIVLIEFHACSAQDTDPLFCTIINCVQFLANKAKHQQSGFLSKMLTMSNVAEDCPSIMFISSLMPLTEEGPLLTEAEGVDGKIQSGYIYQFRIPQEICVTTKVTAKTR